MLVGYSEVDVGWLYSAEFLSETNYRLTVNEKEAERSF